MYLYIYTHALYKHDILVVATAGDASRTEHDGRGFPSQHLKTHLILQVRVGLHLVHI